MKANYILITGSIVTIILILLWQFKVIEEPIAALGSAFLTFVGYLIPILSKKKDKIDNLKSGKTNHSIETFQTHSGSGDNVAGDKIINK